MIAAYCFFDNVEVLDAKAMEEYRSRARPIVESFGGRYLVIGGRTQLMEGSWKPTFAVLLEFRSFEDAERWYRSEEYRELKELRLRAVRSNAVFMEGVSDGGD